MYRPCPPALLSAWIAITAACVEPGAPETAIAEAHLGTTVDETQCDYITCGRNTAAIGNGHVDHVYFDGTPNDRNQQFVSWRGAGGEVITPVLNTRTVMGAVGGVLRTGTALDNSEITLTENGTLVKLRFIDARRPTLPNGLAIWVYRLLVSRGGGAWQDLCSPFDYSTSDMARYAIPGTREVVHVRNRTITLHAPVEGKLSLGCPNSATGKMLSLGALTTTAAVGEELTPEEMRATLLALNLSPRGTSSYTQPGVPVMIQVVRTGLDNHGESILGGREGLWGSNGAICFSRLRETSSALQWDLWSDTHIPPCSEVDLSQHQVLVWSDLFWAPSYTMYPPPPLPIIALP